MIEEAEQIRAVARSVHTLAARCRQSAREVDGATEVAWAGDSADAYRGRVHERAREVRRCADGLDELERRLLVMARVVESRISAVLAVPDQVRSAVLDPRTRVGVQLGLRQTPIAALADPSGSAHTLRTWLVR